VFIAESAVKEFRKSINIRLSCEQIFSSITRTCMFGVPWVNFVDFKVQRMDEVPRGCSYIHGRWFVKKLT